LRVIQNREIQRVGSPEIKPVNVRLIAEPIATSAPKFWREDLRRPVLPSQSIQIRIPSLAERLEDIPLLVQFLLKKYNDAYGNAIVGLTRRAQTILLQHPRPGNVRKLENVISTACITATGDFIDFSDLPEHLQHCPTRLPGDEGGQPLSLDEVRKVHIQKVLQMCMATVCARRRFSVSAASACTAI
jgi:transcriptional regulator with PAS, ATPase and Fis domain